VTSGQTAKPEEGPGGAAAPSGPCLYEQSIEVKMDEFLGQAKGLRETLDAIIKQAEAAGPNDTIFDERAWISLFHQLREFNSALANVPVAK
jgi:hypothetical protein